VWHDIQERCGRHISKSLRDELFQGRQLNFINDLLGDAITIFTYFGTMALIIIERNTVTMTW
jgi:hypothetical protein